MLTACGPGGRVYDATRSSDWDEAYRNPGAVLHEFTLRCRGCGHRAHARQSSLGTPHFAHNPGSGPCSMKGGESEAHWEIKTFIAQAARLRGWEAAVEAVPDAGDRGGWRADVLVRHPRGGRRVAVEVQLSSLGMRDVLERTRRHRADGIVTLWVSPGTRQPAWARDVLWGQLPLEGARAQGTLNFALHGAVRDDDGVWRYAPVSTHVCNVIGGLATGSLVLHETHPRHLPGSRTVSSTGASTIVVKASCAGLPELERRDARATARAGRGRVRRSTRGSRKRRARDARRESERQREHETAQQRQRRSARLAQQRYEESQHARSEQAAAVRWRREDAEAARLARDEVAYSESTTAWMAARRALTCLTVKKVAASFARAGRPSPVWVGHPAILTDPDTATPQQLPSSLGAAEDGWGGLVWVTPTPDSPRRVVAVVEPLTIKVTSSMARRWRDTRIIVVVRSQEKAETLVSKVSALVDRIEVLDEASQPR